MQKSEFADSPDAAGRILEITEKLQNSETDPAQNLFADLLANSPAIFKKILKLQVLGYFQNLIPEEFSFFGDSAADLASSTFIEFDGEKGKRMIKKRREIAEIIFNDLQKNPAPYFLIFNDGNSARLAAMKQTLSNSKEKSGGNLVRENLQEKLKEFVSVDEKTGEIKFEEGADFSEFENAAEKIYEKNLNEIFDPRQKSEFISQKENFISATTLFLFLRETFTDEIEKARKLGIKISDENLQLFEKIEGLKSWEFRNANW